MLKLLVSLVAPTVSFPSRHCACRGRNSLAPPCTPRRRRPTPTPATIGLLGAPRPRLTSSPAIPEDCIAVLEFFPGLAVQTRGTSVNIQYFPRVCLQKGFLLPFVFHLNLVKSITNHRKIQKLQTQFYCAQCNKKYNFLHKCIYF
jgi:hypothetical protein